MIVLVSGGFDPLHVGHLDLLEGAAQYGRVIVALNSDDWLRRKKGYAFMSHADRTRILEQLRCVMAVTPVSDYDGTVCEAIRRIRPNYFANGGDRAHAELSESHTCDELHVEQLFGIGGGKIRSSSQLVGRFR